MMQGPSPCNRNQGPSPCNRNHELKVAKQQQFKQLFRDSKSGDYYELEDNTEFTIPDEFEEANFFTSHKSLNFKLSTYNKKEPKVNKL